MPTYAEPAAGGASSKFNFPDFERTFGQYGVTRELAGRGKFAKVYVAYDITTGRKVAARIAQVDDEDPHEETKVLRKLHKSFEKPYVVEFLQKYENGTHFVMFMEYCEGGSLEEALKARGGPLPLHIARKFFGQLTRALKCMADIKVSHRDLKPANVMLTSKDLEEAELRLIDFGFAKRANMMHSVKGTPAYMAPERVMRESYDFGAEIYAAGVILFEMLFGFQPFAAASSALGIYKSQKSLQLPAAPAVPPDARDMIMRCLDVDTAQRINIDDMIAHPFLSGANPASNVGRVPGPAAGGVAGGTNTSASSPISPLTAAGSPVTSGAAPDGGAATAAPTPQSMQTGTFPARASPPREVSDTTSASETTPTGQNAPDVVPSSSAAMAAKLTPLQRPPLHPATTTTGAVPPGASTPMVRHGGSTATPSLPPPTAGLLSGGTVGPIGTPDSAPASNHLGPTASPRIGSMPQLGMAEEGPGAIILEGAAAVIGVCRSSGMDPGERIVLAAYALDAARRAGRAIAEGQGVAGSFGMSAMPSDNESMPSTAGPTTKTFTTSTNTGFEGGLHGSFSAQRAVSTSFALSVVSSVSIIKARAKEIVQEAMGDLKNPDATTQPAQTLLVNYIRRALLCAARHEFMKEPHCAYGPVLEVYSRCDVLVALLLKDDAMGESRALNRLRDKLADRIIAAHSTVGPFANFSQGELYASQHSSTRL